MLLTRCFGLSLSEQYWVESQGSDLQWERINFFTNPFSEDIGNVLLGKATDSANFDFHSPDSTSDGFLKKRWKIIHGKRCLLKAGSNPFMQQPFNEVVVSLVAERLGIPHIPYTLLWDDGDRTVSARTLSSRIPSLSARGASCSPGRGTTAPPSIATI